MFRKADLVIVAKTDLLPALPDFRLELLRENLARVMPDPRCIALSARSGEGTSAWFAWLDEARRELRVPGSPARHEREEHPGVAGS